MNRYWCGHVPPFARLLERGWLLSVGLLLWCSASEARVQPTIHVSTKTINTPKRQPITFASHILLTASQTDSHADARLLDANAVLQTKDSEADVVCPIKFVRGGAFKTFGTVEAADQLFNIDTEEEYVLLRTTPSLSGIRVKVPGAVRWCAGQPGIYTGCADQPGTHLLLDPNWLGTDLAHEFGHNQGLAGLKGAQFAHRLITDEPADGVVPNEVTVEECRALQQ